MANGISLGSPQQALSPGCPVTARGEWGYTLVKTKSISLGIQASVSSSTKWEQCPCSMGNVVNSVWHLGQCAPTHLCVLGYPSAHTRVSPRCAVAQGARPPGTRVFCLALHLGWHPQTPPLQGTEHTGFWVAPRSEGGRVTGCGDFADHGDIASWLSSGAAHGQQRAPAMAS